MGISFWSTFIDHRNIILLLIFIWDFLWALTLIIVSCSFLYEISFPEIFKGGVVQSRFSKFTGLPLLLFLCRLKNMAACLLKCPGSVLPLILFVPCFSFASIVSILLNFDSISNNFSLVSSPVLEGNSSWSVLRMWRVLMVRSLLGLYVVLALTCYGGSVLVFALKVIYCTSQGTFICYFMVLLFSDPINALFLLLSASFCKDVFF